MLQLVNQGTVAYAGGGLMRDVKNKAVLCKPLTLTKATYCKPHMQSKLLQTGKHNTWHPMKYLSFSWSFRLVIQYESAYPQM